VGVPAVRLLGRAPATAGIGGAVVTVLTRELFD
jgi:hypothetical protein